MSGCFNSDTLETCKHGVHVRLKCGICEAEHKSNLLQSQLESCQERITELERKQEELLEIYKCNWAAQKYCESKKPHVCPLCDGNGKIKKEYEVGVLKYDQCRLCESKGIVWG